MKRLNAIALADEAMPNTVSQETKIRWLKTCDALIQKSILEKYTEGERAPAEPEDPGAAGAVELIMPEPYCDGYVDWLCAKMAYQLDELDQYAKHIKMFQAFQDDFAKEYHRTHTVIQHGSFLI